MNRLADSVRSAEALKTDGITFFFMSSDSVVDGFFMVERSESVVGYW